MYPLFLYACNQNSLNALWMLVTDFCAWVQTWLGLSVGALVLGSPSLAGETCQLQIVFAMGSVEFSSVAQSCLTLCNPMDCSTPGLPVHHQLPKFAQTHVHQFSDAIQPSLSSLSPPALNLSQHQGLPQWVSSSYQVAKLLEFHLRHQCFQWTPRTDLL